MKLHFIQEVIRAMSPNQKRLFKLHGTGVGGPDRKWLQLFDVLNQAGTVSVAFAKKKLETTDSGIAKFADHLFQQLMAHKDQTQEPGARDWLRWAVSLIEAGQPAAAQHAIGRARKLIEQIDDLHLRLEILEWQRAIAETEEERKTIGIAYLEAVEQYRRFLDLKLLRARLGELVKARSQGNTIILESLRQSPVLSLPMPLDMAGKIQYLKCWLTLNIFGENYVDAIQFSEQLVQAYAVANSPLYYHEHVDELYNLIHLYILNGQKDQAHSRLQAFSMLQTGYQEVDQRIYLMTMLTRLAWNIDELNTDAGQKIVLETEDWLMENQDQLPPRHVRMFMFQAMKLEFLAGNYLKCLKWQMRLVSLPGMSTARTPLKVWARCYQLLCIIALDDYEWGIESILRQINRAAKEETPGFELPKLVVKFGRQVSDQGALTQLMLEKWLKTADALAIDPIQGRTLHDFLPFDAFLEAQKNGLLPCQTERIRRPMVSAPSQQQANQA
jgi:hypothetical protein